MSKLTVVVCLLLIMVMGCSACGGRWTKLPYTKYAFQFNLVKKTWFEAKNACKAYGGFLAEPSACDIDKFLRSRVKNQDWWIGGSDLKKEGTFVWNSGSKVAYYTFWNPGEPNDGNNSRNQDCMQYWKGKWDDLNCKEKRPFICQREV